MKSPRVALANPAHSTDGVMAMPSVEVAGAVRPCRAVSEWTAGLGVAAWMPTDLRGLCMTCAHPSSAFLPRASLCALVVSRFGRRTAFGTHPRAGCSPRGTLVLSRQRPVGWPTCWIGCNLRRVLRQPRGPRSSFLTKQVRRPCHLLTEAGLKTPARFDSAPLRPEPYIYPEPWRQVAERQRGGRSRCIVS